MRHDSHWSRAGTKFACRRLRWIFKVREAGPGVYREEAKEERVREFPDRGAQPSASQPSCTA